jgi:outer membrane protein OmpA-like peptidoglycan-associated protein
VEENMSPKKIANLTTMLVAAVLAPSLWAANDMPGGQDHPRFPRIDGAVIYGYSYSDYDAGLFLKKEGDEYSAARPTGKRTRILYIVPRSISQPGVMNNYGSAATSIGDVEDIWSCVGTNCPNDIAHGVVWSRENQIPTGIVGANEHLYQTGAYFNIINYGYAYATITSTDARYHISIFTAEFTKDRFWVLKPDVTGTRSIHIEILEEADFKPTLTVVTPSEITESIAEKGHIALYGIYFDFDSAALKPDSAASIKAIAAAMNNDAALKLYVVGHTDNQGTYEYNLDLSRRRAAAVVAALTSSHGIVQSRLLAAGVGPVAPVASNRSEEGRALNRRVELVEF